MSWLKKIHTFNQKHFKQTLNQTETTNPSTWNLENHFCPFFFASPKKSGDFFPKAPKIVDALQFGSSKYLWRRPIRDSPWEAFVSCSKNWKMHMTKNSVNWGRSLVCCFLLFLCSFFVVVFVAICDFVVVFFLLVRLFVGTLCFFSPEFDVLCIFARNHWVLFNSLQWRLSKNPWGVAPYSMGQPQTNDDNQSGWSVWWQYERGAGQGFLIFLI